MRNLIRKSPHLVDVREHVSEAGGEDDASSEAGEAGEECYHHRRLLRFRAGDPTFPHSKQRQYPWQEREIINLILEHFSQQSLKIDLSSFSFEEE